LSGHKEIDIARHKLTLTFSDIVAFSEKHLGEGGSLAMVIPFTQREELFQR